ncbi:MAG: 16S rRNA (uracil(1498)-N(3))-methyltransferase [Firmicutes bacterium]|nr:16S rRNA (uracil(1498)-N(3))-methyltransferase [Bacillota bacterium]MCL1953228.1 16S rRNA (uracil(1498)-N(3))-methyltransferase [Bacillota bacterium]
MTIRRFFCDNIVGDSVVILGQEHRHLANVLRCVVGDTVILWCGDGYDYLSQISCISKDSTTLNILSKELNKQEFEKQIVLYLGLLKNSDRMEFAIQKAVELGVYKIIPFISQYTVSKKANTSRLNSISISAIKQCGRSKLVEIADTVDFKKVLQDIQSNPATIFAYEKATIPIKFALNSPKLIKASACNVVVGSEGGFSEDEILQLYETTIVPVSLGNRILRAETAAIAVMSLLTVG